MVTKISLPFLAQVILRWNGSETRRKARAFPRIRDSSAEDARLAFWLVSVIVLLYLIDYKIHYAMYNKNCY